MSWEEIIKVEDTGISGKNFGLVPMTESNYSASEMIKDNPERIPAYLDNITEIRRIIMMNAPTLQMAGISTSEITNILTKVEALEKELQNIV